MLEVRGKTSESNEIFIIPSGVFLKAGQPKWNLVKY
jgi:hypothetical protein